VDDEEEIPKDEVTIDSGSTKDKEKEESFDSNLLYILIPLVLILQVLVIGMVILMWR